MSTNESVAATFQLGIERDLENARVMIEDPPWRDNPQKYRKAAEVIIRRTLEVDPENQYAKELLLKAEASVLSVSPITEPEKAATLPALTSEAVATPLETAALAKPMVLAAAAAVHAAPLPFAIPTVSPPVSPAPPQRPAATLSQPPVQQRASSSAAQSEMAFVIQPVYRKVEKKSEKRGNVSWIAFGLIGLLGGSLALATHFNVFARHDQATRALDTPSITPESSTSMQPAAVHSSVVAFEPLPVSTATESTPAAPQAAVAQTPVPAFPKVAVPDTAVFVKTTLPAVQQTGTLAISSPTTVDIYLDDEYLGSAPATLDLPAGNQELEYRHDDMRKVVRHVIKANETATTMITFDVPVRINAKPWAQVYLAGSQRQALGQTPLSDVQVPIGSVLLFENPNFPGKRYRVTGKETEIRVTFP